MFRDRIDAGSRLAERLASSGWDSGVLVLGIPRGGVIVARVVAAALGAELDVAVSRKIGAPGNPELAVGATTYDGTTVVDRSVAALVGISDEQLAAETLRVRAEIERRLVAYRGTSELADVAGRVCIVVDDGLATGATAEAACRSLVRRGAARVVLAVPVASRAALERLADAADEIVCLDAPEPFQAVGQWFEQFDQVTDEEVVAALRDAHYDRAR